MMNVADMQPDELNALKRVVSEFVAKVESVDNEIELLKQDRKDLFEEYAEKCDTKTLIQVLRVLKIEAGVSFKDTFDMMYDVLSKK